MVGSGPARYSQLVPAEASGSSLTVRANAGRILPAQLHRMQGVDVFFFELHEGDNEVYSDVLVVSESEWEPQEFFELVQSIRRRVQDQYHHETMVEAIAIELERDHGFVYVSDDQLTASVNVSTEESDNFLAKLEVERAEAEDEDDRDDRDDDDDDETGVGRGSYRSVLAEFDTGSDRLN